MKLQTGAAILVVDDNIQDQRVHRVTLQARGYRVTTANSAEEAEGQLDLTVPDLILLAAGLRGGAYDLCRRFKDDPRLHQVPVIFVSYSREPATVEQIFACGGVDVIVKPCHLSEFLARVKTHLDLGNLLREVQRLRESDIDANPLTHLPGNNTIATAIQEAIDQGRDMTVIYTDLDNFKAYNDAYGFSAGDDILLFNAETLQTALRTICPDDSFLGHVGGDDFVLLVPAAKAEQVGARIAEIFDAGAPMFYRDEDLHRGCLVAQDRQGNEQHFPIMGISMGGVRLTSRPFTRFVEVAAVCAEVKHAAKKIPGSNLFMDRRGDLLPREAKPPAAVDAIESPQPA
ncbi:MAG: diguanylate cyclase [Candidatus Krumholzibacteriia bacterium]